MIRGLLLAVFAVALVGTPVFAGTKSNATITVNNDTTSTYLVLANPSTAFLGKVQAGTVTAADFQAAGGQQIAPAANGTFEVKAGNSTIYFVPVVNGVPSLAGFSTAKVTVANGKTATVKVSAGN